MNTKERELAVVVGYIMNYSLLNGTGFSGGFFATIEHALLLGEEFLKVYSHTHNWENEDIWEDTLTRWVKQNAESIINKTN